MWCCFCRLAALNCALLAPLADGAADRGTRAGTGVFEPWLERLWAEEGHPSQPGSRTGPLDLRVTKGLGPKGYGKVRVSVVAPRLEDFSDFNFTYRAQFRHRWTENYLHSALLELQPGRNELRVGGQSVAVDLPEEGAGVRGIVWSDPCFSSKWIRCAYADRFQTFNRSYKFLNAAFADPTMNFFAILGDNFYDQTGEITKTLFARLSPDVKRRFLMVVNGNHDNWVCGSPGCGDHFDNFGQGQMQYYAMDTVSSVLPPQDDKDFLSFAVDPDQVQKWTTWQNEASNFVAYHKLGNLGFLTFSGAAKFEDNLPYFKSACDYFDRTQPAAVFLLGHWNTEGMGCEGDMTTPTVREELMKIPSCARFGERLKYMDGHEHCNYVQAVGKSEPYGFMIGAHGMDDHCDPQYGFLYVDSTGGRVALHYFEVDSEKRGDRFDAIMDCVNTKGGLHACTGLADTWLDVPASALEAEVVV